MSPEVLLHSSQINVDHGKSTAALSSFGLEIKTWGMFEGLCIRVSVLKGSFVQLIGIKTRQQGRRATVMRQENRKKRNSQGSL